MPAVSAPAKILVTGASGFIGIHVVSAFLAEGYQVRGTVRSAARAEFLSGLFDPDKFELVVADIEDQDQLEAAIAGVDGIAHVASPVGASDDTDPHDVILPAVDGTVNVLKAAQKVGGVRRIVITGSLLSAQPVYEHQYTFSSADWNDGVVSLVAEKGVSAGGFDKYGASKVLAERAANKWVAENDPPFDIAHVLPCFVYGPVLGNVKTLDDVALSPKRLLAFFAIGDMGGDAALTKERLLGFFAPEAAAGDVTANARPFVDVRDVARAHVAIMSRPELGGGRRHIVSSSHETSFQDYYDAYWSLPDSERPKLPFEAPKGTPGAGVPFNAQRHKFVTAEAELGWNFNTLEIVVKDTLSSIAKFCV